MILLRLAMLFTLGVNRHHQEIFHGNLTSIESFFVPTVHLFQTIRILYVLGMELEKYLDGLPTAVRHSSRADIVKHL